MTLRANDHSPLRLTFYEPFYCFDRNLLAKPVLSNINLDLDRGEIVILTGHSGSGKTTLLIVINIC